MKKKYIVSVAISLIVFALLCIKLKYGNESTKIVEDLLIIAFFLDIFAFGFSLFFLLFDKKKTETNNKGIEY